MSDIEITFPTTAKLTRITGDEWSVELIRKSDANEHYITTLRGVEPTELFTKFGVKVEKTVKTDKLDARANAETLLSDALTGLGSRTIVPVTEVQDLLLDLQNELGLYDGVSE